MWGNTIWGVVALAMGLGLVSTTFGAVILVTNDYPTIQAAIDAADSNDTIQVQAGLYREFLTITKPLHIIGSGSTNCLVHYTNDVLVTITSAGSVELAGLEICGGDLAVDGSFSPSVPMGIVASNTTVTLNDVTLNTTRNAAVTVIDGSLFATNVALYTRDALQQWDLGFQLKGCFARIYQLTQESGQIDHTVNINDPPANFSDVHIENSTIQASHLDYGECVRTYSVSAVVISNCDLYRAPGGDPPSIGNQAIGVNGYSNTVTIVDNWIDNVPTGVRVFGSLPDSNRVKIEHSHIGNCLSNGVLELTMPYEGIDLGGGVAQSSGQNVFSNPGARDVELISSPGNIHALSNCWTTANPDDSIIDQLDSNVLGRVTYTPTYCPPVVVGCSLQPAVVTNVVGLADTVVATVTTNGNPAVGSSVTFSVISGPNAGQTTNSTTDSAGQTTFLYVGNGGIGSDTIQAIATIGVNSCTGTATKVWTGVPPQITSCPSDIVTNTAPGSCDQTVMYSVSASGIPSPAVMFDLPSGTSFPPGSTLVTAIASNTYGTDQCTFNVSVTDDESPSLVCPGDIVTNIPFGQTKAVVNFVAPTVSDNCGVATNYCSPGSGSTFALGTNSVTCSALDSSGNTNTCSFKIVVESISASPDDVTVRRVKVPRRIRLSNARPSRVKSVKIVLRNLGSEATTIDDIGKLTNFVALTIESLGACSAPAAEIVPPRKGFPIKLAPKKRLMIVYHLTFNCANDTLRGFGHEDFRYTVSLDHTDLDGHSDANPANDHCPRGPSGTDRGCGSKDPVTKQLGADILTDVIEN